MIENLGELLMELVTGVYACMSELDMCTREEAVHAIQAINDEWNLLGPIEIVDMRMFDDLTPEDFDA